MPMSGAPEHARVTFHMRLTEAVAKGPPPPGNLAIPIFSRGSLAVEIYTPKERDPQTPHDRDELYFVAQGNAVFFDGVRRLRVEVGSFLFVAAHQEHRFEEFSPDFCVWVVFYGPHGGEGKTARRRN